LLNVLAGDYLHRRGSHPCPQSPRGLTLGWSGPWRVGIGAPRARFGILRSRRAGRACVRPLNLTVRRHDEHTAPHCTHCRRRAVYRNVCVTRIPLTRGAPLNSATMSPGIFSALVEGIIPGVLIWVGTYRAARWAAPRQRTARLAQVLGVSYLIIGVAMTLPIKTHAVALLDMSPPSGSAGPLDFVSPFVASIGVALVMVVVSLFLARGLAAICGGKVSRDD